MSKIIELREFLGDRASVARSWSDEEKFQEIRQLLGLLERVRSEVLPLVRDVPEVQGLVSLVEEKCGG